MSADDPGEPYAAPEVERARFRVRPPTMRVAADRGGGLLRLNESEGWIDVSVRSDGSLEIRGPHVLEIAMHSGNTFVVRIADDARADDETVDSWLARRQP